jgi:ketosteroid isomerase-like protein
MKMQELLDTYYRGLAQKEGWESVLAEDMRFVGGDMTKQEPVVGKQSYVQVIQRLSRLFADVRVVKSFVDGDQAFVLAEYNWTFPHDVNIKGTVAEYWKVRNGKLGELTIFFDTGSFDRMAKG